MTLLGSLPYITIPVIFLAVALLGPSEKGRWRPCAICVAVSASWLAELALRALGLTVNPIQIALMIGMSASGLLYQLEKIYRRQRLPHFWVIRLLVILGGLGVGQLVLIERWGAATLLLSAAIIAGAVVTLLLTPTSHEQAVAEAVGSGQPAGVLKRLENCCGE